MRKLKCRTAMSNFRRAKIFFSLARIPNSVTRFGKVLEIFYGLFRIWANFEPTLPLFAIGQIFIAVNGQMLKTKKSIHLVTLGPNSGFKGHSHLQYSHCFDSFRVFFHLYC